MVHQAIYIPPVNRYEMYASKSKKTKQTKPSANPSKTKRTAKCTSEVSEQNQNRQNGKVQTMFESQFCSGESSVSYHLRSCVYIKNLKFEKLLTSDTYDVQQFVLIFFSSYSTIFKRFTRCNLLLIVDVDAIK